MPAVSSGNVKNWASIIDAATLAQAQKAARLPIVHGHIALMPDAHLGIGATIGSVIPTKGAIIPAAVGVDIGCGMVAAETTLTSDDLPDDLEPFLQRLSSAVPAGMGQGHAGADRAWTAFVASAGYPSGTILNDKQRATAARQYGTLGSGNHFWELCLDERDRVWVMLHSGSRGVGNQLAQRHIARAKNVARGAGIALEDPDLAYFLQGTAEFEAYISDVIWAQAYAAGNRRRMVEVGLELLASVTGHSDRRRYASGYVSADGPAVTTQIINCHHNYTALEEHFGTQLWITRKGAILARKGDLGIIPGSMGARSFIVRGKGNADSYMSCSHGAGRAMSRNAARRQFTEADLQAAMGDRTWLRTQGRKLIDEIPQAYKDIDTVMADQTDLVEVVHTLTQVLNYKGT